MKLKTKFGDERRSEITIGEESIEDEDLIPREEVIITITHTGYIKRLPVTTIGARSVEDVALLGWIPRIMTSSSIYL